MRYLVIAEISKIYRWCDIKKFAISRYLKSDIDMRYRDIDIAIMTCDISQSGTRYIEIRFLDVFAISKSWYRTALDRLTRRYLNGTHFKTLKSLPSWVEGERQACGVLPILTNHKPYTNHKPFKRGFTVAKWRQNRCREKVLSKWGLRYKHATGRPLYRCGKPFDWMSDSSKSRGREESIVSRGPAQWLRWKHRVLLPFHSCDFDYYWGLTAESVNCIVQRRPLSSVIIAVFVLVSNHYF